MIRKIASLICWLINVITYAQITPTYDEISIPMRDGQVLSADIIIPNGVDSAEVILIQTPYNKNTFSNGLPMGVGLNVDAQPFIWVIVDWRGFYGSNGADVSNFDRGEDGYDICQWISEQTWHKDNIGTWGPSALGGVQYATAREQHPNHTCAVPLVAHPQQNYQDYFYGGCLEDARLQTLDALGYGLSPIILANPYYSFTWQVAENNSWYPSDIIIPTLQIGGWYDHNIDRMMTWYEATRTSAEVTVRDEQWLLVGPWVHGGTGPAYVGSSVQGELSYPNAAGVSDVMAWDFLNYYLRGEANGWETTAPITYYETGLNSWATSTSSSIINPNNSVTYLSANGLLISQGQTGSTSFSVDPNNPSPTIGGANLSINLDQGPYDQISLNGRSDVVGFTSHELSANVSISGRVSSTLFVSSDRPDGDLVVRLIDVYPDGREMLITDGIKRIRFRNGYTQGDESFMSPGEIYEVTVDLPFTNYKWLAGHKIKIMVAGNSASRWDVNLQDGGTMYQAGTGLVSNMTIFHDENYPSRINLPGAMSSLSLTSNDVPSIHVYPNPTSNVLHIDGIDIDDNIEIIDVQGRVVYSERTTNQINVSTLVRGIYQVRINESIVRFVKE